MTWIILSISFFISTFILFYICRNLLLKNEKLEDNRDELEKIAISQGKYVESLAVVIQEAGSNLTKLDEKGSFKSDDEIGWFFNYIKGVQELINGYNIYGDGKETKEEKGN